MRDLTLGALELPEDYKVHNINIEMDVYMDGNEEFDVQGFAQFMRMVLNEWSNDHGFYKRPRRVNGIPIIEDTKTCPRCDGEKWIEGTKDRWPCDLCGMAGEIYDEDKIFAHQEA